MSDYSAVQLSEFAKEDTERLYGAITQALVPQNPWLDTYERGTFPKGVSEELVKVISKRASTNDNQVAPTMVPYRNLSTMTPKQLSVASVTVKYSIEGTRGYGPRVNLQNGFYAYQGSFLAAQQELTEHMVRIQSDYNRLKSATLAGTKIVALSGTNLPDLITGGKEENVGIPFAGVLPDSHLSLSFLDAVNSYLRERKYFQPFIEGGVKFARLTLSHEALNVLRSQFSDEGMAYIQGKWQYGDDTINGYSWQTNKGYRDIVFAEDPTPLRFNVLDGDGQPVFIAPTIEVVVDGPTNQKYADNNPDYDNALYEIAILSYKGAFRTLTPEVYTGEGTFKFDRQMVSATLEWQGPSVVDPVWKDTGFHNYQFVSGFEPLRANHCVSVAFKRKCLSDTFQLEPEVCTS